MHARNRFEIPSVLSVRSGPMLAEYAAVASAACLGMQKLQSAQRITGERTWLTAAMVGVWMRTCNLV